MAPPTPWVLGGGISMMKNIFAEQQLRQGEFWIAFPNVSHPVAAWPANHPNYFLLGFIAALAPKFHPALIWSLPVRDHHPPLSGAYLWDAGCCWLLAGCWLLAAAGSWLLSRRTQESPGEARNAQGSPGKLRGAQENLGESRGAQRNQGAQAALESPGEPRGSQESPGKPRSSQESPGEPFEVPNV